MLKSEGAGVVSLRECDSLLHIELPPCSTICMPKELFDKLKCLLLARCMPVPGMSEAT